MLTRMQRFVSDAQLDGNTSVPHTSSSIRATSKDATYASMHVGVVPKDVWIPQ
jgi:hypothetical protein